MPVPVCPAFADLDCSCALPCQALGSAQTTEYNGGSLAITEAHNEQVPDKLYQIDAISARDQSTAANQVYN